MIASVSPFSVVAVFSASLFAVLLIIEIVKGLKK